MVRSRRADQISILASWVLTPKLRNLAWRNGEGALRPGKHVWRSGPGPRSLDHGLSGPEAWHKGQETWPRGPEALLRGSRGLARGYGCLDLGAKGLGSQARHLEAWPSGLAKGPGS